MLLAGVVFVNVAVLRLNLALDSANRTRAGLQAQVAVDQSELSVALTASNIQARAHALGLVPSDQSQNGFINLATPLMASEKQANRRIRLLFVVFALLFAATLARAGWLQVVKAAQFSKMAVKQHEHTVTVPAWRGTIFDRDGADLALGVQTTTVFADPTQLRSPRKVAVAAGKLLGVDPNTLYPQLLNKKTHFVYIERFADPVEAAKFLKKRLHRRQLLSRGEADVPAELGRRAGRRFAGTDDKGLDGLELQYNTQLSGSPGCRRRWTTRSAARSTSSSRAPSAKAPTCTRRSTTSSRRRPSRCCARR